MIARGELETEHEARGSRYKVRMLLADDEPDSSGDSPEKSPGERPGGKPLPARDKSQVEDLINLRLQVKNLEDLATYEPDFS